MHMHLDTVTYLRKPRTSAWYAYSSVNMSSGKDSFVFFYKASDDYGYMSQWYKADFYMGEKMFTTAEQFMMYMKAMIFDDHETANEILSTPDRHPSYHKTLGRSVKNFDAIKWMDKSLDVVAAGNYYKFTQNPSLMDMLMRTYGRVLVEASPYDRTWGIGYAEEDAMANMSTWGLNMLGTALMMVREKIKEKLDPDGRPKYGRLIDV